MAKGVKLARSRASRGAGAPPKPAAPVVKKPAPQKFPLLNLLHLESKAMMDINAQFGAQYRAAHNKVLRLRNGLVKEKIGAMVVQYQEKEHAIQEAFWVRVIKNAAAHTAVALPFSVDDERIFSYCSDVQMTLLEPEEENEAIGGVQLTFGFRVSGNPYFKEQELSVKYHMVGTSFFRSAVGLGHIVGVESSAVTWNADQKPKDDTPMFNVFFGASAPSSESATARRAERRSACNKDSEAPGRVAARKFSADSDKTVVKRQDPTDAQFNETMAALRSGSSSPFGIEDALHLEPLRLMLVQFLDSLLSDLFVDLYPEPMDEEELMGGGGEMNFDGSDFDDEWDDEDGEEEDDDEDGGDFDDDDDLPQQSSSSASKKAKKSATDAKKSSGSSSSSAKKPMPKPAPECKQQ